ncbi:hypothetical protein CCACVL1_12385 [Corchorus capsularis]|uniref:Uncharacterized protein n=1 Tax=Corchorus capsularis TaxID=210143 RepID=A0A1R3IFY9_COCAP|nr:hypothetical protein CCACVL1_12385 [Corchorus capsularis]
MDEEESAGNRSVGKSGSNYSATHMAGARNEPKNYTTIIIKPNTGKAKALSDITNLKTSTDSKLASKGISTVEPESILTSSAYFRFMVGSSANLETTKKQKPKISSKTTKKHSTDHLPPPTTSATETSTYAPHTSPLSNSHLPHIFLPTSGGDFNEIASTAEKSNFTDSNCHQCQKMQDVLHACNLMDLGFVGPKYTWYESP